MWICLCVLIVRVYAYVSAQSPLASGHSRGRKRKGETPWVRGEKPEQEEEEYF